MLSTKATRLSVASGTVKTPKCLLYSFPGRLGFKLTDILAQVLFHPGPRTRWPPSSPPLFISAALAVTSDTLGFCLRQDQFQVKKCLIIAYVLLLRNKRAFPITWFNSTCSDCKRQPINAGKGKRAFFFLITHFRYVISKLLQIIRLRPLTQILAA